MIQAVINPQIKENSIISIHSSLLIGLYFLVIYPYGGPGGSRTHVQNTFLFASYSNNARMAFRLTPTVLGVVGSSRNYQDMYGLRVA